MECRYFHVLCKAVGGSETSTEMLCEEPRSRLSQVSDDGFHFRLEEGAPLRLVVHGLQLLHEHGATLDPSVEGLLSGFGTAAWLVEQSQFGLAIGADLEHVFRDFGGWMMVAGCFPVCVKIRNICHLCNFLPFFFTFIRTYRDIAGHRRTLRDIAVSECCIFALLFRNTQFTTEDTESHRGLFLNSSTHIVMHPNTPLAPLERGINRKLRVTLCTPW